MNAKHWILFVATIGIMIAIFATFYSVERKGYENRINFLNNEIGSVQNENRIINKHKQDLDTQLQDCSENGKTITYYYTEGCSYCEQVGQFIKDNKIEEKIAFTKKDIMTNRENSYEQQERYNECTKTHASAGVPFVYAKKFNAPAQCILGFPDIEAFFKKEMGI
jgi:hypothetical protein